MEDDLKTATIWEKNSRSRSNLQHSGRKIREVGRTCNIPEATLRDKLKTNVNTKRKLERTSVFNCEQESVIKSHVIKLANIVFDIIPIQPFRQRIEHGWSRLVRTVFEPSHGN
jgi:hypothetical protein